MALQDDRPATRTPRRKSVLGRAWKRFGNSPRVQGMIGSAAAGYIRLVGSTNRLAEHAVNRPVNYREVLATAYHNLGIDVRQATVHDLNHRPRYLVENFEPVRELA